MTTSTSRPPKAKRHTEPSRETILDVYFGHLVLVDKSVSEIQASAAKASYLVNNAEDDETYEGISIRYPSLGCPMNFFYENFITHSELATSGEVNDLRAQRSEKKLSMPLQKHVKQVTIQQSTGRPTHLLRF
jgi:hypothetical protein